MTGSLFGKCFGDWTNQPNWLLPRQRPKNWNPASKQSLNLKTALNLIRLLTICISVAFLNVMFERDVHECPTFEYSNQFRLRQKHWDLFYWKKQPKQNHLDHKFHGFCDLKTTGKFTLWCLFFLPVSTSTILCHVDEKTMSCSVQL